MRHRNANPTNEREAKVRQRALAALARMRREKMSLAEAARLEHIKPSTVLRHIGSAVRQDRPGGRYRATAGDKFRRDLQVPTVLGPVSVPVHGSKSASEISQYSNAVAVYLRTGKLSQLERFKGKTIRVRGNEIELITDPGTLSVLAQAGALQLDQLYAAFAGTA
jgi:hypothetical protein